MQIEKACLPALAWLELAGVPLDAAAWQDRAAREVHRAQAVEAELYATLRRTTHGHSSLFPEAINRGVLPKYSLVLQQLGHPLTTTDSTALSALAPTEPLAALVLDYREAQKRASTYGEAWLRKHLHSMTHRVHADYLQLGSVARPDELHESEYATTATRAGVSVVCPCGGGPLYCQSGLFAD